MKSKTYGKVLWLYFVILFSFPAQPVFAETDQLLVAIAQWPPWKIIDQGKFGGIDVEILREIGKRLGITFKFVACPWKRCVEMAKIGDVDMITSFGKTTEREAFVYYLGPPYRTGKVVFYKEKDKPFSVRKYEDLYKFKIGVLKGSAYFDPFDSDPQLDKVKVAMDYQLPHMLFSRRIDLIAGWEISMDYFIAREGFRENFETVPYGVSGISKYMAMSKKSKALKLIPELSALIRHMVENKEIDRIINAFLKRTEPRSP
jgi:polar amino acid transport system substrate-binding protein